MSADVDWTDTYRAWRAEKEGIDESEVAVETVETELPAGIVDAIDSERLGLGPAVFEVRVLAALAEVTADRARGPDAEGAFLDPDLDVPDGNEVATRTLAVPLDETVAADVETLVGESDRFDDPADLLGHVAVAQVVQRQGPFDHDTLGAVPDRVREGYEAFVERVSRGEDPDAVRRSIEAEAERSVASSIVAGAKRAFEVGRRADGVGVEDGEARRTR